MTVVEVKVIILSRQKWNARVPIGASLRPAGTRRRCASVNWIRHIFPLFVYGSICQVFQ